MENLLRLSVLRRKTVLVYELLLSEISMYRTSSILKESLAIDTMIASKVQKIGESHERLHA